MVEVGTADAGELIREALRLHRSKESVLLVVESQSGSLGELEELLLGDMAVQSRVVCASSCQADSGGLAEAIQPDGAETGAIIVENAQWADPTSLGRIQRVLGTNRGSPFVVLAHQPMSGLEAWGIDQLARSVRNSAHVVEVMSETPESTSDVDLDPVSTDLIATSSLLTRPISVADAAQVLDLSEADVLHVGHDLASRGLLREVRGGFMATASGASAISGQEARLGRLAGLLADALARSGTSPALVGSLRFDAGQYDKALPLLTAAATTAGEQNAAGEAFRLASRAIESAENADAGDSRDLGAMHLLCARFLRSAGRTEWAAQHAQKAISLSSGPTRLESLYLAAILADDSQRPQEAENLVAVAEWEATHSGDNATMARLLAFRARVLNRIGFAIEADDALAKAEALIGDTTDERVRFDVANNRAWIHFDRGELGRAEIEFTHLRDQAERLEGWHSVADKEAWRARSLMPSGHPLEALQAIASAVEIAETEGLEAPLFLTDLATAEGATAYGRHEDALAASERALDLVERQLPAWQNMALATRARVHLAMGNLEAARSDLELALERTPEGADGWRWRTRCQALLAETGAIPDAEAEDLADLLLQSKLYGWAAETLCAIAERSQSKTAAKVGMTVALSAGLPMVAARAAHAGGLWADPDVAPVILAIHGVDRRVPDDWREHWEGLAHVSAALAAPAPVEDPDLEEVVARLDETLLAAGLSRETTILSPSQRRSSGLVLGGGRSRSRGRLWMAAAALGVVVLAAGTAFGVAQMGREEPEIPAAAAASETQSPSTTIELSLEETQIPVPDDIDFFFGTSLHRGAYERSGFLDVAGPREVNGYYWRLETAGPIEATPVAFGTSVYVGTTEGTFFALDQTTGAEIWTMPPEGRIGAAPALGQGEMAENQSPMMVVVVDDDGAVRGHDAAVATGVQWTTRLGTRIRSSPVVVDGVVYVATDDGFVHALDLIGGSELWRYPSEDPGLGTISADLTFHEGILYVGTEAGILHMVDVTGESPALICEYDAFDAIVTNPIVADEIVYVATMGQNIWPIPAGSCDGSVPNRLPAYVADTPVRVGPAVVGDTMYMPG
ncbi:MAG TPA: PQQ-binding-like beta-propeller repeat protein, partial [Acidimicrobiia bacterium]